MIDHYQLQAEQFMAWFHKPQNEHTEIVSAFNVWAESKDLRADDKLLIWAWVDNFIYDANW